MDQHDFKYCRHQSFSFIFDYFEGEHNLYQLQNSIMIEKSKIVLDFICLSTIDEEYISFCSSHSCYSFDFLF